MFCRSRFITLCRKSNFSSNIDFTILWSVMKRRQNKCQSFFRVNSALKKTDFNNETEERAAEKVFYRGSEGCFKGESYEVLCAMILLHDFFLKTSYPIANVPKPLRKFASFAKQYFVSHDIRFGTECHITACKAVSNF